MACSQFCSEWAHPSLCVLSVWHCGVGVVQGLGVVGFDVMHPGLDTRQHCHQQPPRGSITVQQQGRTHFPAGLHPSACLLRLFLLQVWFGWCEVWLLGIKGKGAPLGLPTANRALTNQCLEQPATAQHCPALCPWCPAVLMQLADAYPYHSCLWLRSLLR